jgi:tetratricopeptide (TPR) repeat protein
MCMASSIGPTSKHSILTYPQFRNFDDARKAYANALKHDPKNQNILRDLGQLQIQLRDYDGYQETRRQIMMEKPNLQTNWLTYAVAAFLVIHSPMIITVLE